MAVVDLTSQLADARRAHVEGRLQLNLMAWLTTVRADGRPDSVPVWFLVRADSTILIYSEPGKLKLRNIAHNPQVSLGLDVTDLGRDIIRIEGTAQHVADHAPADQVPDYVVKYTERIGALFGTPAEFAARYSQAIVVTPQRLRA